MAKRIDAVRLIDQLGRRLQSEMTYDEIRAYLRAFGVDIERPTSGVEAIATIRGPTLTTRAGHRLGLPCTAS